MDKKATATSLHGNFEFAARISAEIATRTESRNITLSLKIGNIKSQLIIPDEKKSGYAFVWGKALGGNATLEVKLGSDAAKAPLSDKGQLDLKGIKISWDKVIHYRVICINDVYELENLARFKTALDSLRSPWCNAVLAGDFVSPSLLSSLDKGRAMVDVLNKAGIDLVCIGNHEADIPHAQLVRRIKESKFTWVNSNMRKWPGGVDLPEYVITKAEAYGKRKSIGILGLNTDDAGLYGENAFNGATITPIAQTARTLKEKLCKDKNVDLIIPMTHQRIEKDRKMAEEKLGFPLIIGGHDHAVYHETTAGARIIKTGADAVNIGVCDVYWTLSDLESAKVDTRLIPAKTYAENKDLKDVIAKHELLLKELERSALCKVPKQGVKLSSKNVRVRQTTIGYLLASGLRDALQADCALLPSGNIRGNCDYPADLKYFTYAHLKKEMPFRDMRYIVILMPGKEIVKLVRFSRRGIYESPVVERAMFLQLDSEIKWDEKTNTVTHIGDEIVSPERMYRTVVSWSVLGGMDKVTPLLKYAENNPESIPDVEHAKPAREILVDYFAKCAWINIVQDCKWTNLDKNGDGVVSHDEVFEVAKKIYGNEVGKLVVDNLMASADLNQDKQICQHEIFLIGLLGVVGFIRDSKGKTVLNLKKYKKSMIRFFKGSGGKDKAYIEKVFHRLETDKTIDTLKELTELVTNLGKNVMI